MAIARHGGRVVLVTGAGSGIGRATALRFATEEASVIACDIDAERLEETRSRHPASISAVVTDVSDGDDVNRLFAEIDELHGRIDILANVAGILDGFAPAHLIDDRTWRRVMAVNVDGPMMLTRAALGRMIKARSGAIVNVASVGGLRGGVAGTAYIASKHAVIGLTRSVAWLYAREGIRCNAVCPGSVATNIRESEGAVVGDPWGYDRIEPIRSTRVTRPEPDEIASVISWVSSEEARNVNGAIVTADGGWTAG